MENSEFVNVQKNGYKGRLHITTWKRIGMENNKEGWVLDVSAPSEVAEIREKKIANQQVPDYNYQSAPVIAEKSEPANVNEEEIVKTKRKYTKK